MVIQGTLPRTIRAEVKFTTSGSVSVPDRELAPLRSSDPNITGLLAVLFWSDGREMDGKWLVVDAADSLVLRRSSFTPEYLRRAATSQPGLASLRRRIEDLWPPFLIAYLDTAKKGHLALSKELQSRHAKGQLQEMLPTHEVLTIDHRAAMLEVVEHCGRSGSGRIFQRLFAYLLGLVGYRTVTVNTIGVPDVVASDPAQEDEQADFRLTVEESRRLVRHCRLAGDTELASRLLSQDRRLA
jgi:hypothetical protein